MKFIKAFLFIGAYLFIYILLDFVCLLVFGLTTGGGIKAIVSFATQNPNPDPALLQKAIDGVSASLSDYAVKNAALLSSIASLIALLIYIKIFKIRRLDLFSTMRMTVPPSPIDIRYAALSGASANFVVMLIMISIREAGFFSGEFDRMAAQSDLIYGTGGVAAAVLGFVIVAPLIEETIFRGMITYELKSVISPKAAIFVQGALFGLFHIYPLQIMYALPLGIYFGFIAYKTNSIWPTVAGHACLNLVAVVLQAPGVARTFESRPQYLLFIASASVFIFIITFMYFLKKKPA